jgi:hypothetical protein
MKNWSFLFLLTFFFACNESGKQTAATEGSAELTPATPAGKINVSFPEGDTGLVKIVFELDGKTKEKTFELPLADDAQDKDLYRTVWDKPNSCYIGVLKKKHSTRYYHASTDGKDLSINHVGTPPEAVWHYAEQTLGLGKVELTVKVQDSYKKNLQSGKIIADFIVKTEPASSTDSVRLYSEFGGANKRMSIAVPEGYRSGIIEVTGHPEQVYLVFVKGNKFKNAVDISVKDGHLQINKF